MKSKLKFIVPLVLLAVLGGAYKTVLAKPPEKKPAPKVHGDLYVLPKEFLVNLAGGRFARLTVALVLDKHVLAEAAKESGEKAPEPPEGFGTLPQEAVLRDVVTDTVSGTGASQLLDAEARERVQRRILKAMKRSTDVKVEDVLFTDVVVQ